MVHMIKLRCEQLLTPKGLCDSDFASRIDELKLNTFLNFCAF